MQLGRWVHPIAVFAGFWLLYLVLCLVLTGSVVLPAIVADWFCVCQPRPELTVGKLHRSMLHSTGSALGW